MDPKLEERINKDFWEHTQYNHDGTHSAKLTFRSFRALALRYYRLGTQNGFEMSNEILLLMCKEIQDRIDECVEVIKDPKQTLSRVTAAKIKNAYNHLCEE